jgi:hypothetical protein
MKSSRGSKKYTGSRVRELDEITDEVKKDEAYFSTGEISRLLGRIVSQSTVTRLFDQGKLGGRVNPITGRREIKWGAVIEWLKEKGLSPDKIALIEKQRGEEWVRPKRKDKNKEAK